MIFNIDNFIKFITTIFTKLQNIFSSELNIDASYTNTMQLDNIFKEYINIPFIYNIPIPLNINKNIILILLFIVLLIINLIILFIIPQE